MNDWKKIAEQMYFDDHFTMKAISEVITHIPYRTIQKSLQRNPRYKANVQNAIDELERVVKKQVEQLDKLDATEYWIGKQWKDSNTTIIGQKMVIGIIGDLHAPFTHKGYIHFLKDTFEQWGVNTIIYIGDIVDNHAISRHQTETSAKGAEREYQMAYDVIQEYVKAFPKARVCLGNHDDIPNRQAATLGLPTVFMNQFKSLWGLPEDYQIANHFIIDDVLYHHGLGASGQNGAINKALNERMSVVQGHQHSSFQLEYRANQKDIIFGISCGCGVDNSAYAFNYGKYAIKKPILGTAIIKSSSEAYIVPMGEQYFGGHYV